VADSQLFASRVAGFLNRLVDMGDGSHAEQVVAKFAAGQRVVAGGVAIVKTAVPVVSTSPAYSTGDCIGSKMTFTGICRAADITGLIQKVTVYCKSAQTGAVDLILFHTDPSGSTFTDNSPLAIVVADFDKIIDVIHITDWTSLGTPSFAKADNIASPFVPASGASDIYGALVARSTPTLGSTTDIKVAIKNLSD
jgi:hypothetical protein